jgi:hypothetical protein
MYTIIINALTKDRDKINTNHAFIVRAKELVVRGWEVKITPLFREANSKCDWLANSGLAKSLLN